MDESYVPGRKVTLLPVALPWVIGNLHNSLLHLDGESFIWHISHLADRVVGSPWGEGSPVLKADRVSPPED